MVRQSKKNGKRVYFLVRFSCEISSILRDSWLKYFVDELSQNFLPKFFGDEVYCDELFGTKFPDVRSLE